MSLQVNPRDTVRRDGEFLREECLHIGGEWVAAASGESIELIDPATGTVWATVPSGGEEDIQAAVAAARGSFDSRWRDVPGKERAALLRDLAAAIRGEAERIAFIECRDNGKALREVAGREVPAAANMFEYFAGMADKVFGDTIPLEPHMQAYTIREPVGVVGAIIPWNAPFFNTVMKLAPALAAGNTIVLKPAELACVSVFELVRLVERCGFPAGTVNLVTGYGETAGEALVRNMGVEKIAFTGETSTARRITESSVGNLKRLSFELGGKGANIIFADADYDTAFNTAVEAAFIAAGQSCTAGSRILVERPLYDRFVRDLVDAAEAIRVGDPLHPDTQMGAQTSLEQLEKIEGFVAGARDAGAVVSAGGERAEVEGLGGYFYRPTVLTDVMPEMEVWQREIFGPVTIVAPFEGEEEAVELANGTEYGLTAGFWTKDIARAHRMTRALRAGTVWVNTFRVVHYAVPYGGVKMSGYGRELGTEVMQLYTEVKAVLVDHGSNRPVWFERGE